MIGANENLLKKDSTIVIGERGRTTCFGSFDLSAEEMCNLRRVGLMLLRKLT